MFLGTPTCPACYGRKLCPYFRNGSITFRPELQTNNAALNYLMRVGNIKNVYHGQFDGKNVIIKRLAHDRELNTIDRKICELASVGKKCNVSQAMSRILIYNADGHIMPDVVANMSDFTRCPSLRLLDLVMENWQEKKERLMNHEERLHLFMTLTVNPEPVIIQVRIFSGCFICMMMVLIMTATVMMINSGFFLLL